MRRIFLALGLAVGFAALGAGAALADGGPHGGYTNPIDTGGAVGVLPANSVNTDACAGCHRAHTGQVAGPLLKEASIYQLCADCHNGTGSVLDVLDGVRLNKTANAIPSSSDQQTLSAGGTPGILGVTSAAPLNGGGFEYFKGQPVTSRHQLYTGPYDGVNTQTDAWGAGVAPPGVAAPVGSTGTTLDCVSCHNQHGGGATAQYRMLKAPSKKALSVMAFAPADPGSTTPVFTSNEFGRGLDNIVVGSTTYAPPASKYTVGYYAEAGLTANTTVTVSGTVTAVGMGGFFGPDSPTSLAARNLVVPIQTTTVVTSTTTDTVGSTTLVTSTVATTAKGPNPAVNGMSLFCGACHTAYASPSSKDATYKTYSASTVFTVNGTTTTATYTGNDFRHPTEIDAHGGFGNNGKSPAGPITVLNTTVLSGSTTTSTATMMGLRLASDAVGAPPVQTGSVPLANVGNPGQTQFGDQTFVTCLTCHNAHGSSALMVGFAEAGPDGTPSPTQDPNKKPNGYQNDTTNVWNVNPDYTAQASSLLVGDNRAMCESCHQKGSPVYQPTFNGQ